VHIACTHVTLAFLHGPPASTTMPRGEDDSCPRGVLDRIPSDNHLLNDTQHVVKLDIPNGYPPDTSRPSPPSPPSRRPSLRLPMNSSPDQSRRRSRIESTGYSSSPASPGFTSLRDSLREKDDPYFLALPDASRTKILSNSAPDLNTLPHPPPRAHRRVHRDPTANGNGRLMEQLHSSRRHTSLGVTQTDIRPSSRRSMKPPFLRRSPTSSGSSSPNYGSDSESEIFEDDHSNVGSNVSTRPSSFNSNASFSETFLRSASTTTLDGKLRKRNSLAPSFSHLDLRKKRDSVILPERDSIEVEDCRFLEIEYQRYHPLFPPVTQLIQVCVDKYSPTSS
jgi:hypothetical protein